MGQERNIVSVTKENSWPREVKSKAEKERYKHLNAEFQRIQGEIRKPSSVINAKK